MPAKRPSRLVIALAAVALLLGVGVLTFLLGPIRDTEPSSGPADVELDLTTVRGSSAPTEDVLRLPWGAGPTEASRKGDPVTVSTIEAVFSSDGFTFVVDHPADVYGARVRWFSADGALTGSWIAPPGSTLFRPQPGGFNFVSAKSGGRSETAVIYDIGTSTETTYTIPLQVNSGGLFWSGDTLYAQITPSQVDFEEQTLVSSYALVPVAIGGVQVEDAAADAAALEIWGFGADGKQYISETHVDGLDIMTSPVTAIVGSGDRRIRVPQRYRLLGVDSASRLYLSTLPELPDPAERIAQTAAVWSSAHEPFDEVLVINLDGTIHSTIILPYSSAIARYDGTVPVSLSEDGIYSLRADEGGVTVVLHRFQ